MRFVGDVDDPPLLMDVHVNNDCNRSIRWVGTNDSTTTITTTYFVFIHPYSTAAATTTTRTAIYKQGTDRYNSTDVIQQE